MRGLFRHALFVVLAIAAVGFIYWGLQFSPPSVCEAHGGDWDSVYVKCVEEGQTFWDKYPFPPKPCDCKCDCCDSKKIKENVYGG